MLIKSIKIFSTNTSSTQLTTLETFNTFQGNGQDDYAAIESIHAYNSSGPTTLGAIIVYTKPIANASIFNEILRGRPQLSNDLRITNLSSLTVETAARKCLETDYMAPLIGMIAIGNWVWAHLSFSNNATTLAKVNDIMQDVFTNLPFKAKNYSFSNVYQPIPRAISRRSAAMGGNVLGLNTGEDIVCTT